jgi:hypothetical protein
MPTVGDAGPFSFDGLSTTPAAKPTCRLDCGGESIWSDGREPRTTSGIVSEAVVLWEKCCSDVATYSPGRDVYMALVASETMYRSNRTENGIVRIL